MWNAIETAKRFAAKGMPVMLYGETEREKKCFAQSIHNASPRYNGPFVAINCAGYSGNIVGKHALWREAWGRLQVRQIRWVCLKKRRRNHFPG